MSCRGVDDAISAALSSSSRRVGVQQEAKAQTGSVHGLQLILVYNMYYTHGTQRMYMSPSDLVTSKGEKTKMPY